MRLEFLHQPRRHLISRPADQCRQRSSHCLDLPSQYRHPFPPPAEDLSRASEARPNRLIPFHRCPLATSECKCICIPRNKLCPHRYVSMLLSFWWPSPIPFEPRWMDKLRLGTLLDSHLFTRARASTPLLQSVSRTSFVLEMDNYDDVFSIAGSDD